MQVMKKSMLLKCLKVYCLNFKAKPILNTRYYAATCKMYINIYTQRQGIIHIYNLNINSNMEPLRCLLSSENLGEATSKYHIHKKRDVFGNIVSKFILTMIFKVSKEISTQILGKVFKK